MYNENAFAALLGGSIILILIVALLLIAVYAVYVVGLWKLFKKAGKNGWEAIIPFYNTWVLIEISGLNWWYFLIAISGTIFSVLQIEGLSAITNIASLAVNFFCFYNIAKKMHQNEIGFGVAGALVPVVLVPILGLSDKYTFDSSVEVSPNGPIGAPTANNNTSNEPERYCLGCGQKLKKDVQFCENCGKKVD